VGQGCANAITFLKAVAIAASISGEPAVAGINSGFHSVALDSNNQDWGWGRNSNTQIFPINVTPWSLNSDRTQAIHFNSGGRPWLAIKIAAGAVHTCMMSVTEGVFCRGHNGFGQLGPTPSVDVPSTQGARDVAAGGNHTCAVVSPMFGFSTDSAGSVACWGENGDGQVNGIPGGFVTTPAFLPVP
jgi:alpha-tubulin suppressor-like RCC1 family protein